MNGFPSNLSSQDRYLAVDAQRFFLARIFLWMSGALIITGLVAYYVASNRQLLGLLFGEEGMSPLGWFVLFSPIVIVLLMSFLSQRMKFGTMLALFILYSVLMGASLSSIFLIYTGGSIAKVFFISSSTFMIMGILGLTTKSDLSRFGRIMMVGLIGILIAGLVNFFLRSSTIDYLVSIVGVLVFMGLTAYDLQKLKQLGGNLDVHSSHSRKMALMGALTLYLDFINLFLSLLRLMDGKK